jgi:predicted ATP-dependent serine protease
MAKAKPIFTRSLNIKNVYSKKHTSFDMDGEWKEVLGEPEKEGAWLIYGSEKNGKTWFTLILANYLSKFEKLHYISAEEGMSKSFQETCKRINIEYNSTGLSFVEYEPLRALYARLQARKSIKIVVIDNLTFYNIELRGGALQQLLADFPKVLFIFLAHEERGQPYTATAKMAARFAKIIIVLKGWRVPFRVDALAVHW